MSLNTALKTLNNDCPPCTTRLIQEHLRKNYKKNLQFNNFKPPVQMFWVTIERLPLSRLHFQTNL